MLEMLKRIYKKLNKNRVYLYLVSIPAGYEADVEHGLMYHTEIGESCDEKEEGQLIQPLTTCLVPPEVQQRLWITQPLQHCISLLKESLKAGPSENW